MEERVVIDGSLFEGGGQMIRNSLTLATLTRRPVRFTEVRANRPNPGFNNQLISIFSCFTKDKPKKGSTQYDFVPSAPLFAKIRNDSAASCTLVTQTILPLLLFRHAIKDCEDSDQSVITGGTLVSRSPPLIAYQYILGPLLERMGFVFRMEERKRGYYPKGGGELTVSVESRPPVLRAISLLEPKRVTKVVLEYTLCS
jgi:RNA 3'-terminal phosphate cyclase (ATP)